jgi:aminoglycoside 3-N-acetyltransferase
MIQKDFFHSLFDNLNIKNGDTLLIATNLKKIIRNLLKNKIKFDSNIFINYFLNRVGENGTILFPTYNFSFCEGIDFDYNNTESKMGFITNTALSRADFTRTKHPIYSFAVSGKYSNDFFNLNNKEAFGKGSPFAFLYKLKAKMLLVDVDYQNSFTFVHYAEQQENAKYRFHKNFNALYTNKNGLAENKVYSMFVRKDNIKTNVNPIGEILEQRNLSINININTVEIKLINLFNSYDVIVEDIRNNNAQNLMIETR